MPKPQQRVCQHCGKAGHNLTSCPKLAQQLLRSVQKAHSPSAVVDALKAGGSGLKVTGTQTKFIHRKAHKLQRRAAKGRKKAANERRRCLTRSTKDEAKLALAAKRSMAKAWKALAKWRLAKAGARGNCRSYPCPRCHAGCTCTTLDGHGQTGNGPQTKRKKALQATLAVKKRKLTSVFFRGSRCGDIYNDIKFFVLHQVKYPFPLPALVEFVKKYHAATRPELQQLCKDVGMSRSRSIMKLFRWLLWQEANLGYEEMQAMTLKGVVEGDGTGLKLFKHKGKNCHVALWGLAERPRGSAVPRTVVYFVPVKKVAPNAVCPVVRGVKQVECREDVLASGGLDHVATKSVLVSDGARLYARLAREHGLRHRFCVHSKGIWNEKARVRGYGTLDVNTGMIDERWSRIKEWIPKGIWGSDGEGNLNVELWSYVYQWWFRCHHPLKADRQARLAEYWGREA
ncbi:unnamed protein product [Prorocentrum cordatum]|uniref:CCHC-type domain-containing protein n=1 Tax=Prorocentrum cordatum TaxID=2364126 RepID=A0ABN9VDM8_9DINO|nr:unnamed protein product [Polarella glacialis]CAK0871354.1 unnamed protein product [Polarella glacialis]